MQQALDAAYPSRTETAGVRHLAREPVLLGLIGSPIGSSAAPLMHAAAGEAAGLCVHYQLIDVAQADDARLRAMLDGVRLLGFSGVNVTFPYKERIVPLLDSLAPDAALIGSVNT